MSRHSTSGGLRGGNSSRRDRDCIDWMPTCPDCDDLNEPWDRACRTCGAYLYPAEARRDAEINLDSARRRALLSRSVPSGSSPQLEVAQAPEGSVTC